MVKVSIYWHFWFHGIASIGQKYWLVGYLVLNWVLVVVVEVQVTCLRSHVLSCEEGAGNKCSCQGFEGDREGYFGDGVF